MPEYRPHDLDPSVLGPYDYVTRMPGKDVRGKLVDAFQMWLKIPPSIVSKIKVIVGMLHNASLL
jgi:geranylgeranyl diphosphate synthase type 3